MYIIQTLKTCWTVETFDQAIEAIKRSSNTYVYRGDKDKELLHDVEEFEGWYLDALTNSELDILRSKLKGSRSQIVSLI